MTSSRPLAAAAMLSATLLATSAPRAAETEPTAFVAAIYQAYKGEASKGVALDAQAAVRRLFTPSLAKLLIDDRDAAGRRGEVGKLEIDPFVAAQDWRIGAVDVRSEATGPRRARATASFSNLGQATTVRLDLVNGPGGWRIDDIRWDRGGGLRAVLAGGR